MSELEEVAQAMVKRYWEVILCRTVTTAVVRTFVRNQMDKDESEAVIEGITHHLVKILPDHAPMRSDGKPAHVWTLGSELGFKPGSRIHSTYVCINCGVLKGSPGYPETACKGKVKVALR